jgi:hypothetical protein
MRPAVREAGWLVMMTSTKWLYARTCALPAIAAALALSSTPVIAQEAQPVSSAPAQTTATQPAADEPAATPDASTASSSTTDTSAQTTTKKTRTIKRTARVAAAKPAPVAAKAMPTVSARTAAPASAAAPPKPAAAPASPQSAVAPVVNYKPKPAPPQTHAASAMPLNLNGETLPIAGGALALLVVGGAAAAVGSRRRKRREQEWADAQTLAFEPFEETATSEPVTHEPQPASVPAAPAFAWGPRSSAPAPAGGMSKSDDRRPGETWVERAYRGPTPNNPSVSLRNRLKRAAFFDKREREAAAGLAAPVNANAGLPGAMAGERELA